MSVVTDGLHIECIGKLATGTGPGTNSPQVTSWTDLKGNHNGALSNSGYTTACGWAGSGSAGDPYRLVFNGATNSQRVNFSTVGLGSTHEFTYEVWAKLTSSVPGCIVCETNTASTSWYPTLAIMTGWSAEDGKVSATRHDDDTTAHSVFSTNVMNGAGWHHFTLGQTVTPTQSMTLWVDGVSEGSSVGAYQATTNQLNLGFHRYGPTWPLTGEIATFRAYTRKLSLAEVQQNYAAGILAASTESVAPTVITTAISNITDSSADSGGTITNEGSSAVTQYGVCWNTSGTPTIADSHTTQP